MKVYLSVTRVSRYHLLPEDVAGFNTYIENYKAGLPIEEAAVKFK